MTVPEWGNTGAGAASTVGLIVTPGAVLEAWITGRSTRRLQADIHTATQSTLADMRKGFTETLERMDQRTERMNILAEERHREALELIAALKR